MMAGCCQLIVLNWGLWGLEVAVCWGWIPPKQKVSSPKLGPQQECRKWSPLSPNQLTPVDRMDQRYPSQSEDKARIESRQKRSKEKRTVFLCHWTTICKYLLRNDERKDVKNRTHTQWPCHEHAEKHILCVKHIPDTSVSFRSTSEQRASAPQRTIVIDACSKDIVLFIFNYFSRFFFQFICGGWIKPTVCHEGSPHSINYK